MKDYRPLVYVCSPYSTGDVEENVRKARKYCRYALEHNTIPLAPHLHYPQFMDDNKEEERKLALRKINYVLLGKCDAVWVFGENITSGIRYEISIARKRNMTIKYIRESEVAEWERESGK